MNMKMLIQSFMGILLLSSLTGYSQSYTMKAETFEGGALYNWRDVSCEYSWVENPKKAYPNKSETVGSFKKKYLNGSAYVAIYGDLDLSVTKTINLKVLSQKATKLSVIIGKDDMGERIIKSCRLTGDGKWHTYTFNFTDEITPEKEKGLFNNIKLIFDSENESKELDVYYFDEFELVK